MPVSQDEQTGGMFSRLRRIGALRDALLVGVSIVYVLGYSVWSINAWVKNLGLLPALDSQYFAAGVIPALLLLFIYAGIKIVPQIREKLRGWWSTLDERMTKLIPRFLVTLDFLTILGAYIGVLYDDKMVFFTSFFIFFIVSMALISLPVKVGDRPWIRIYFIPVNLGVMGLVLYLFIVYPNLPQELGGLRPRCAYIDIVRAQVSKDTLEDIMPSDRNRSNTLVVQSKELEVLFSSRDFILVRPHGEDNLNQLRRKVIQAITWCSKDEG